MYLRSVTFLLCILLCGLHSPLASQPPIVREYQYIDQYSELAMEQMTKNRIPASVILAQAIFESGSGTSALARKSNNHFGIKCHRWIGDTVIKTDDVEDECFRKYNSIRESFIDHSYFLKSRPRYAHLFDLAVTDYVSWCYGLKAAGYATFPRYAEELINIIEKNKLYELDRPETLNVSSLKKTEPKIHSVRQPYLYKDLELFISSGLLLVDEKHVHIRSLDMVVEAEDDGLQVAER